MVKEINLEDKLGQPIKRFTLRIDGDTVSECERILRRFYDAVGVWLEKCVQAATKDGTTADGNACSDTGKLEMAKAEEKLKKIFDDTFGEEVYQAFFGIRKPFAAVGGAFYCTHVLNTLETVIREMMGGLFEK